MPRPPDATLTVAKAARLLGVHPNTIRAWSDRGRLRFYRINDRGDRRYRLGDLQRFLAAAEQPPPRTHRGSVARPAPRTVPSIGADIVELRTRPTERLVPAGAAADANGSGFRDPGRGPLVVDEPALLAAEPSPFAPPLASPHEVERRVVEIDILGRLADLVASGRMLDEIVAAAVDLLHGRAGHDLAVIYRHRDGRLTAIAARGEAPEGPGSAPGAGDLPARAMTAPGPVRALATPAADGPPFGHRPAARIAVAIPGGSRPWGVLLTADSAPRAALGELETFLVAVARQLGVAVHAERLRGETATQLHRAEALRRIATDIGSKLDLGQILAGVVDHARALFGGERVAVFLRRDDDRMAAEVSRGLSDGYLAAIQLVPSGSISAEAMEAGRPLFATGYRDDPRAVEFRAAVVQEGYDTICSAPLRDGDDVLGLLNVYHDLPHPWTEEELATLAGFAAQAATAIRKAQDYQRMATWTAHLQAIQHVGAELGRLKSEEEIAAAIAAGLDQLIDCHNVRVYRLREDGWLVPVAIRGIIGERADIRFEDLRVRLGEGITGWVAQHRIPQNLPDADADPRAVTIPGTAAGLEESMLLAPLVFEEAVLGVVVLSKLGVRQFTDDDLRLLEIYANLAAQAMANADATARLRAQSAQLERRLAGQRALLDVTASVLETLDLPKILDRVADHLADLVRWDNISIEWVDAATGLLTPLMARGIHADEYIQPWEPGEEGLATWVLAHGEPQLVRDELADPRIRQFATTGDVEGSMICVPLRGRRGVSGVVSLERLGTDDRYDDDDFALVQLFAAQVSIAIRNAEAYRAMEIDAQTDDLTGLLNKGTFDEWLARSVERVERFALLMLDLDGFKAVNDRLGHQAGDDVLRAVAKAIRGACRDSDLVFRYGGDEFTVLCPGTDAAGARAVAERIRAAMARLEGDRATGSGTSLTASIGFATFPEVGPGADEVLLAADRACFAAKRRGRDRVATAEDGIALAGDLTLHAPTPLDPPDAAARRRGR